MEQRRVRLGDVLDDYCPRERRVTNHAVVALVDNDIKLTRCTTCDTEHPYKAARVPPRRQTRLVAALSSAGADGAQIAAPSAVKPAAPPAGTPLAASPAPSPPPATASPAGTPLAAGLAASPAGTPLAAGLAPSLPAAAASPAGTPLAAGLAPSLPAAAAPPAGTPFAAGPAPSPPAAATPDVPLPVASGPIQRPNIDSVRRPLIRATLGRPDPAVTSRPAPVFTMRENEGRAGNIERGNSLRKRRNGARSDGEPNGNRVDGPSGQFARAGFGKNGTKSVRRSGNGRPERFNKSSTRSRGKSRSR